MPESEAVGVMSEEPKPRRHLPFYLGVAVAVVVAIGSGIFLPALAPALTGIGFFLTYLIGTGLRLPRLDAEDLRRHSTEDDEPMPIIFAVTLAAIAISVVSLFLVLNAEGPGSAVAVGMAFVAVALGWLTIHTMTALHYARLYWRPSGEEAREAGGLRFPGTDAPGISEFIYFAFVIGMTAQTADVEVTDSPMRRAVVLHGVVAFFFNTVLVAAAVNAAVAVAG